MKPVILLLASFVAICAQNTTQSACSCYCGVPSEDGPIWGVYGSFPVDDCSQCTGDNAIVGCPKYVPDKCTNTTSYTTANADCGPADLDDDWDGDWVIDPCSSCVLDGTNVGDCIPCCDPSFCDCIYGTVSITDLENQTFDGTEIRQIQVIASGTSSQTTINVGNETSSLGTTATLTVPTYDTYDLIKHGDSLQLKSRTSLSCNVNATRNPPQTSILKLVLLLVGVGIAALACIIFCCCNPCKKKKQGEKLLGEKGEGEGQEGVPYNQVPQVGGINYTGGTSNP